MANAETWRARAVAWKESGKRSEDFCREHGLKAGELRSWTSKLGLSEPRKPVRVKAAKILPRLARVVPRPCVDRVSTVVINKAAMKSGVAIRVGRTRIDVGVGYDGSTLRSVLQILNEVRR